MKEKFFSLHFRNRSPSSQLVHEVFQWLSLHPETSFSFTVRYINFKRMFKACHYEINGKSDAMANYEFEDSYGVCNAPPYCFPVANVYTQ